ncbi:hypothetical protein ACPPVO_29750 [Dactylosporangium sp. McL0621]|uniref:hypothetical protein n=1 Tax=Dactylosporangium sp. McL0621 TaxID=3415678 RepID=UPI003CEA0CE5
MAAPTTGPDGAAKRRRGRKRGDIQGFGPAAGWAGRLRDALDLVGPPTRRELAKRLFVSTSTLSEIDDGRTLPEWDKCRRYLLIGCAVPEAELGQWERWYEQAAAEAARLRPDLRRLRTRADVRPELLRMLDVAGVTLATCAERAGAPAPRFLPGSAPGAADLVDEARFDARVLAWIVYLAGGTQADVRHWQRRYDQLPEPWPDDTATAPPRPEPHPQRPSPLPGPASERPRGRAPVLGWVAAGALGATLAGVLFVAVPGGRTTALGGRGAPPALGLVADGGPAGDALRRLAESAEALPAEAEARYRCIHRVAWTDERAARVRTDEQVCWANDAPGRLTETVSGRGPAPVTRVERLEPGLPPGTVDAPGTDPGALFALVARQRPKPDGDVRPLLLCLDIADRYPLGPAQRGAVLRMLAARDGIVLRGQGADGLGRPGLAVSADGAAGSRVTLFFDREDGRLLGGQTVRAVPAAGGATTTEDVAYAEAGWSATLQQ